jgi:hypothetical protein
VWVLAFSLCWSSRRQQSFPLVSDALQAGVGVAQVSELLEHTRTDQVMRHYSMIRERTEYMLKVARKAASGG